MLRNCVSVQETAAQHYCTVCGEAKKDKPEDGVDEAEEGWADAVRDEANGNGQCGEPGHHAGDGHQDSPTGGAMAQD